MNATAEVSLIPVNPEIPSNLVAEFLATAAGGTMIEFAGSVYARSLENGEWMSLHEIEVVSSSEGDYITHRHYKSLELEKIFRESSSKVFVLRYGPAR